MTGLDINHLRIFLNSYPRANDKQICKKIQVSTVDLRLRLEAGVTENSIQLKVLIYQFAPD